MVYNLKQLIKLIFDRRPVINLRTDIVVQSQSELLKNRCALVTGGSSGIGLSIAKAFINAGAYVIITGRDSEKLHAVCSTLKTDKICTFVLDNTNIQSFESSFG